MIYQHYRILFFAWSIALGCLSYYTIDIELPLYYAVILALIMAVVVMRGIVTAPHADVCIWCCLGLFAGFAVAGLDAHRASANKTTVAFNQDHVLEGVIVARATDLSQRLTITFRTVSEEATPGCTFRFKASARFKEILIPGRHVRLKAKVYDFYPPTHPSGWDSARHFTLAGFCAQGYVKNVEAYSDKHQLSQQTRYQFIAKIDQVRRWIAGRLDEAIDPRYAPIAKAMAVGIRTQEELDYVAWQWSGLAHLLAISGLHMGIVFFFCFILVRRVFLLFPCLRSTKAMKHLAAVIAIGFASAYLLFSGMSVSAQRAYGMALLAMVVMMLGRKQNIERTLAIILIFVLIVEPSLVLSVGFQLSYVVVTALALYLPKHQDRESLTQDVVPEFPFQGIISLFPVLVKATAVATIATWPLLLYHFGSVSLLGFITNLIAIPVTTFLLVPSLFLGIILMPIGWEAPLLWIAEWGLRILDVIVHETNQWTHFYGRLGQPAGILVILYLMSFMAISKAQGTIRVLCIVGLMSTLLLYYGQRRPVAIVSASEPVAMLQDAKGVVSNTYRLSSFEQSQWLRFLGVPFSERRLWSAFSSDENKSLTCSDQVCHYRYGDKILSLVFSHNAHVMCYDKQVIVFWHERTTDCQETARIITKEGLDRMGTLFLYPKAQWKIKGTQDSQGAHRPWRQ